MKHISFMRRLSAFVLSLVIFVEVMQPVSAASKMIPIIILSQYRASLSAGEEFFLAAVSSDGQLPAFKSSNSRIAAVNTYGRVTAKKAGTCRITAKVSSGEASCEVKVKNTQISINTKSVSLENGESFQLQVSATGNMVPVFSCNKKSVAVVDSNGLITACKPGDAIVTVQAGQTKVNCRVKVKKPTIRLSHLYVSLFRCQQIQLTAEVSSGRVPVWKSNKSSVATVDENGLVEARKHGTALISARVDGITRSCEVEVQPPQIKLAAKSIVLRVGEKKKLDYTVSSGNTPVIKSSKPSIVKVDKSGSLTAKSKGTAIISISEDGTKETCSVRVTG